MYKKFSDLNLSILSGNKGAEKELLVCSDFECPYCRRAYEYMDKKINELGDIVLYIANAPLSVHQNASFYAEIFEAGIKQRCSFASELFFNNEIRKMDKELIIEFFANKTPDKLKFISDLNSQEVKDMIVKGTKFADDNEAEYRPTIFIKDKKIVGFNNDILEEIFNMFD